MLDEFPIKGRWPVFLDRNDAWFIQCVSLDQPIHAICVCIFKVQRDTRYSDMFIGDGSGYYPLDKFIKLYIGVASGPNLSLAIDHMFLLHFLDFAVIQWSLCRNCSGWNLLLLSTLHLCRFSFNMQLMILMRSNYRLSSLAIASVDGCCLYIVIHNNTSCRTWL